LNRSKFVWLAVLIGAATCVALAFNNGGVVSGAADADMLWPASFMWDLTTRADGWRGHNLPRVPSLLPDLLVWVPLAFATGAVRWTVFLYGILQITAFVAVGGWIAARIAGRERYVGGAAVLAVLAVVVAVGLTNLGAGGMLRAQLLPVVHAGPMVLALLIAASTAGRLAAGRSVWPIAVAGMGVFLSDRLLLVDSVLPLTIATVALVVGGRIRLSQMIGAFLWLAGGIGLGWIGFTLLLRAGVSVDPVPEVFAGVLIDGLRQFVIGMPALIAEAPIVIAVVGVAALASVVLGLRLLRTTPRSPEGLFLLLFVVLSAAGSIAFTAFFFVDSGSTRYLASLWLCVIVVLGAGLASMPNATRAAGPLAAATLAALLIVFAVQDHGRVAMLRWKYDVAECVRKLRGPLGLHAGLAEYWVARPAEVALHWSTQIDQITEDGRAYLWSNDARWFRHSLADPSRPPDYDFVVLRRLDPARIAAHYGKPDSVVPCFNTEIWIYRDRAALYAKVAEGLPP